MENKMNCEIIKDLMPSYIDGICSESSRLQIEAHMCECEECKNYYEAMTEDEAVTEAVKKPDEQVIIKEVNKKLAWDVRKKTRIYKIICVVLVLVIMAMILPVKRISKENITLECRIFEIKSLLDINWDDEELIKFGDCSDNSVFFVEDGTDINEASFYYLTKFGNNYTNIYVDREYARNHDYISVVDAVSDYDVKSYSYSVTDKEGQKMLVLNARTTLLSQKSEGSYVFTMAVGDRIDVFE